MKVTEEDISKICKVSRTTVYRALNGKGDINPKTKQKIVKTARALGYTPNTLAVSLVKGSSMTIGVVVFDFNNYFFSEMISAIEREARKAGYFVYLTTANHNPDEERECIEHLVGKQVSGLILYSSNNDKQFVQFVDDLGLPVVTICNKVHDNFTFVGIDDKQAAKDMMRQVAERGYRRVFYVTPEAAGAGLINVQAIELRVCGYIEAHAELGFVGENQVFTLPNFLKAFSDLDIKKDRSTAILAANDFCALKILAHLNQLGYRVPEDIGLTGFDDIEFLGCVNPPLTTVKYPIEEVGSYAVHLLLKMIEGGKVPMSNIMPYEVVKRKSL